eukprot:jgi/Astpho2/565/gw1.00013.152.1_t
MQSGLVERDTEVRLLLLAALAGEHVLYVGPPGTAKSELGRRLTRLCKGTFFERLLTRFSVPEELFGPLSMRALEEDQYVRQATCCCLQTEGYLPQANVAFIDEVFKANSAILNTLLTVLNERLFDNGAVRETVPLLCLVGASNELPESEELDALYDRFLIRRQVQQVSAAGLPQMLSGAAEHNLAVSSGANVEPTVHNQRPHTTQCFIFVPCRQEALQHVKVPGEVIQTLADLRQWLQDKCEPPVYVSDRRLVKAVALMQVAAYTSGRDTVTLDDCLLLQHILWQRPEEASRISDWLLSQMAEDNGLEAANYILRGVFGRACNCVGSDGAAKEGVIQEAERLRETLVDKLADIRASTAATAGDGDSGLWTAGSDNDIVRTSLLPKLRKTQQEHEKMLYEVVTLQAAFSLTEDQVVLTTALGQHWVEHIRNGPIGDIRRLG